MSRYLPALVACVLAASVLPVYLQALVGVGLGFYLALGVKSTRA